MAKFFGKQGKNGMGFDNNPNNGVAPAHNGNPKAINLTLGGKTVTVHNVAEAWIAQSNYLREKFIKEGKLIPDPNSPGDYISTDKVDRDDNSGGFER